MSLAFLAGVALQALSSAEIVRMGPTPLADSVRVRKQARDAQHAFEARRVSLLPFRHNSGSDCEVRIGRMCYSWGGRDSPRPPEEPPTIADARAQVIGALRRSAALLPGDEWVVGQLVQYLIEADSTVEAQRVAETTCADPQWWCDALAGWAAHEGQRFGEAEAAFERALAAMPEKERCQWENLDLVVENRVASRLRGMSCAERRAVTARIAWLSRPLFSREGNDLLTEHYSRLTLERVLRGSRNPYGIAWGGDLRELLVRYGWATAWTRRPESTSYPGRNVVSGQERGLALNFFPDREVFDEPARMSESSWSFEAAVARSRYAPKWAAVVESPPHQLARFRRGDSLIVVATYDVSRDTLFSDSVEAALALVATRPGDPHIARERGQRRGRLVATAPRAAAEIASLELLDRSRRGAARARWALRDDRGEPSLSDVLLFEPADAAEGVDSLHRAVGAALPAAVVRSGAKVGAYWEMYSLSARDSIGEVALTLSRDRGGTLRRAAEALRLATRPLPVTLEWRDRTPRGARVVGRSVVVDLGGVPPGRYTLELDVRSGGRELQASRPITVLP